MPTETEFEQARVRFDNAAEDAEQLIIPVRQANGPDVLTGGRLTADIDTFIDTTGNELNSVAVELRTLAEECARRAEECRQAEANFTAYLQDYTVYQGEYDKWKAGVFGWGGSTYGDKPIPPPEPSNPPDYVDLDLGIGALVG